METLRFLSAEGIVNSADRTLFLHETFTICLLRESARYDRRRFVEPAQGPTRWRGSHCEYCVGLPSNGWCVVAFPLLASQEDSDERMDIVQSLFAIGF